MTPKPHELLASAIEARRRELGLSLREVADIAGVTGETLRAVRKGSNEPSSLTKSGIERALSWEAGSVDAVLGGGRPVLMPPQLRVSQVRLSVPAPAALPVPTDDELRASGLAPETIEALLDMRRHVERLVAKRDERAIRQANRVLRALDEGQDAG